MTAKDGIYTMTETEFNRELARAWEEGWCADVEGVTRMDNPYRLKLAVNAAIKTATVTGMRELL